MTSKRVPLAPTINEVVSYYHTVMGTDIVSGCVAISAAWARVVWASICNGEVSQPKRLHLKRLEQFKHPFPRVFLE